MGDIPDLPAAEGFLEDDPKDSCRVCRQCGRDARIVSNRLGVQAYCGHCKIDWPVSGPRAPSLPITPPKSFSREALIDQTHDYSKAFEPDEEEHEQSKKRKPRRTHHE